MMNVVHVDNVIPSRKNTRKKGVQLCSMLAFGRINQFMCPEFYGREVGCALQELLDEFWSGSVSTF